MDWDHVTELENWATDKMQQIGPERTLKLIRHYADKGRFSEQVRDDLIQLVSIYRGENQRRAAPPPSQPQPRPTRPAASQQRKSRPPQAQAQPATQPSRRKHTAQQPPAARPKAAPKPSASADELDDEESSQGMNVVLRLIAGVHNAGAGVKRGTKRG
jgi:hypothetical protein